MAEPALDALIEALRRLPGVGVKSAQRMAFHLLQHDRDGASRLARALQAAVANMRHCERCHTFTEGAVCRTCLDASRDADSGEVAGVAVDVPAVGIQQRRGSAGDETGEEVKEPGPWSPLPLRERVRVRGKRLK